MQSPAEYWQNNHDLQHITPPGERFPEVGLFDALREAVSGSVFEFGCGDGRLSPAFSHKSYIGYDINQSALDAAKKNNPQYRYVSEWEPADTFLAYTVFLHIPDEEVAAVIKRAKEYKRIVIGEIMGREWRRPGNPPVFNRDIEEYIDLVDMDCEIIKVSYPRYGCDLDLLVFL